MFVLSIYYYGPRPKYGALDGYFGENNWKVFFKRWFMGHTGLDVVQVDSN